VNKLAGRFPEPSSSWLVGRGGAVHELRPGADPAMAPEAARPGRPLTGRQRAESTCSACGGTGHNARNRKKCPSWVDR